MNIWDQLNKPVIGLSPMDGITDAVFRYIVAKYGKPDVMFTEFENVDGIKFSREPEFKVFLYHESERPVIAQIFGKDPQLFYYAAQVIAELGFDGVDINMGCPSKNVAGRGAGAGLIRNPGLAQEIIAATKKGVTDWAAAASELLDLPVRMQRKLAATKKALDTWGTKYRGPGSRNPIAVSVKTRIGYAENEVDTWIPKLIEAEPACISIHGRTYKQMYSGKADWEAIGHAAALIRESNINIKVLGNGDVTNREQALELANKYQLDGVLIGRASLGRPWIFTGKPEPDLPEIVSILLDHARIQQQIFPKSFFTARKHLAWYLKGFPGAAQLRSKLVQTNSPQEVAKIISDEKLDKLLYTK
jgi:tRNA-dihydrouridine synthase B